MEIDLSRPCTQAEFGAIIGVTQQAVGELISKGVLKREATMGEWLLAYAANLREQAAGRSGDSELVRERARLAKESADKVAMVNARARRELAPVVLLTAALAQVSQQLAVRCEGMLVQIQRRAPDLPEVVRKLIADEVQEMRLTATQIQLDLKEASDGPVRDPDSDPV